MIEDLMREIASVYREGGEWCALDKAQGLAALVIGLRPKVACEIGVWMGGSLIPIALAMRTIGQLEDANGFAVTRRRVIAIDSWSPAESTVGQEGADADWWRTVDHEEAMRAFLARLDRHGLEDLCRVVRAPSSDAEVPDSIDLLHVDGNHADQAIRDVVRFAPAVPEGGILVLDDLDWRGGYVRGARAAAMELGFVDLYPLGSGVVMQRRIASD